MLVVLIGRAAKAAEYLSVKSKSYRAVMRLGLTTDTEDITGKTLTVSRDIPSPARVCEVANSFVGEIMQTPPMYSALKVNGQKLCDLARRGIEVEREARPITIHAISCRHLEDNDYELQVSCSSGTYIRTLCADIGKALGCGGAMATLCRSNAGGFSIDESVTLDELESLSEAERIALLKPTESLFHGILLIIIFFFFVAIFWQFM